MEDFERTIGFQYLKAVHLNDSKGEHFCKLQTMQIFFKACYLLTLIDTLILERV